MQYFMDYLLENIGMCYVWGGQGEKIPDENWVRDKEKKQGQSAVERATRFYLKRVGELKSAGLAADGLRAFDCSGLIVRFMLDAGLTKTDMTAAGLYSKCLKFAAKDLRAGDLLFRHNGEKITHVGVYMGDGTAIEARGRDWGVVRLPTGLSEGSEYWTHFGRIQALSDLWRAPDAISKANKVVAADGADDIEPLPSPIDEIVDEEKSLVHNAPCFALVSGRSVYIRSGAGVKFMALGVAHEGDMLVAGDTQNGFAQAAIYSDGAPVAGYISERYIRRLVG